MADEIPISGLPAVVTPLLTDYFPVVQAGVTKRETAAQILSLNPNAYPFVVGATGNYPATFEGLQQAITDADGGMPVFVQVPGVNVMGVGSPILMPGGTKIKGAFNEMPPNALLNIAGSFVSTTDISKAKTVVTAYMKPLDPNAEYYFENICIANDGGLSPFSLPDGNNTVTINVKNSWICNRTGAYTVNPNLRSSGNGILNVNLLDSLINQTDAGLIDLESFGGSVILNLNLSGVSVAFGAQTSQFYNTNVTFNLSVGAGSSYIDTMGAGGDLTGCAINYTFASGCTIGTATGDPFLIADDVFSDISLNMQQTTFMADISGGGVPFFQDIGGITLQYAGSGSYSYGITLNNFTAFCDDTVINEQILLGCADIFYQGSFTPHLLFGGGNVDMLGDFRGSYIRTGKQVDLNIRIALVDKGSSTGQASISDLPFVCTDLTSPAIKFLPAYLENATLSGVTYTSCAAATDPGNHSLAAIYDFAQSALGALALTDSNFTDTTVVNITGTYWVN